jgi:replication factor A1
VETTTRALKTVDLENIVQQILLTRRDLTREEILKKIYEKKRSAEDYFLDEVAARIVAVELGVEVQGENETFNGEIKIKNLVSGLNDVTITGRITATYPVQTFSRNDGTQGKVARLALADETGDLKLVLWDDKTSLVETGEIKQGQILKVLHAYVRESFNGKLELHLGRKGELETSPKGIDESRYPYTSEPVDKIAALKPEQRKTNVVGWVTQAFPASEFTRKDGTGGKVRRLRLKDETGETTIVLWNEKVDELAAVNQGDTLTIIGARIKTQLDGRIEIHIENTTQVKREVGQAAPNTIVAEATRRIAELTEGGPFTVEATIATDPVVKEVVTQRGEAVLVASLDLKDETGSIAASLWRNHAESARNWTTGTKIKMIGVYVKKGFSSPLELTSRTATSIHVVSKPESANAETRIQ